MILHWPWHKFEVPYALPMRELGFNDEDGEEMCDDPTSKSFCWEDFDRLTAVAYPVPWFFQRTIPHVFKKYFWWKITWPTSKAYYWVKSHTWRKFHLLDLRNSDYKYGYADPCNQIMYSCFNVLKNMVEKEDPELGLRTLESYGWPSEGDEMIKEQLEREKILRDLYTWWVKGRKEEHDANDALNRQIYRNMKTQSAKERRNNPLWDEWSKRCDELSEKDDVNLKKLIELRNYLWT